MSGLVERRSGAANQNGRAGSRAGESRGGASLLGLLHEGFYLLFLLKNGAAPQRDSNFMDRIADFLAEFDRAARQQRTDWTRVSMLWRALRARLLNRSLATFSIDSEAACGKVSSTRRISP